MLSVPDEYRKERGVYAIENTLTGKRYIGSAFRSFFSERIKQHIYLLRRNAHYNRQLQSDWDSNQAMFRFIALELLPYSSDFNKHWRDIWAAEQAIRVREQHFIDSATTALYNCGIAWRKGLTDDTVQRARAMGLFV